MGKPAHWLHAFDVYPKTVDDLKERTLGGACISIACIALAFVLFFTEFSQYRAVETDDRLDVDVTSDPSTKLRVNVDIYLPSLPCDELVTEVVDESGLQELAVTDSLHKLRMDRHGVPIDIPQAIGWGDTIAPAFQQRKVIALMDEARDHLVATLDSLEHEEEQNRGLTPAEHEEHKRELAEQAALLQGRLARLAETAQTGEATSRKDAIAITEAELRQMHASISKSKLYSEEQRALVLNNLHAMERNLKKLPANNNSVATNLHEALRIRLTILQDNVQGFVSSQDVGRKQKYQAIEQLLSDLGNSSRAFDNEASALIEPTVAELRKDLETLASGARGAARRSAEQRIEVELRALASELRGEKPLPADYCGPCYGAAPNGTHCCNTCAEVLALYRERKWGFPDTRTIEQCMRESRQRADTKEDHEGCNVYGTMQVARVTGSFNIAPASKTRMLVLQGRLVQSHTLTPAEVAHFNVTHHIRRLSFGTDFPGQRNPLDKVWTHSPAGAAISRYFLKVVPTTYEFLNGRKVNTNQFSVTQYFKALDETSRVLPAVSFTFELTPLRVRKTERRGGSMLAFFTRCAALIGGLFTVAGIIDSFWYHSSKQLVKMSINKQT